MEPAHSHGRCERPAPRAGARQAASANGGLVIAAALALLAGTGAGVGADGLAQVAAASPRPPEEMTTDQDHRRMLDDLLGIASLRAGADEWKPQAPNAANYDESKPHPFRDLPDPVLLKSGRRVTTARLWSDARRAEVVESQTAGRRSQLALSFDDLPVHAGLPPDESRADVARSILKALGAHHAAPTYGFVNGRGLAEAPEGAEVLRLWREAGHPLANHTFSHMDLDASAPEAFEQDVLANEPTLRAYMGSADWHWLRFPYLHEGDTIEKRGRVARFLGEHGYRVADVSISFDDWAFSDPYVRCMARNDLEAIESMKQSYVRRADDAITAAQEAARLLYGRDIAHVMLLHFGAFSAVMLPQLLDLVERRGFELVTLAQAHTDPAYVVVASLPLPPGMPLLQRMSIARGLPLPKSPDDLLARLGGLCQ